MKKETILGIAVVLILVTGLLVWNAQPQQAILGTWQGDDAMEFLGETPLDGAERLEFHRDGSGTATANGVEADFTWSIAPAGTQDLLVLQVGERTYGRRVSIHGNTMTLDEIEFTRE